MVAGQALLQCAEAVEPCGNGRTGIAQDAACSLPCIDGCLDPQALDGAFDGAPQALFAEFPGLDKILRAIHDGAQAGGAIAIGYDQDAR